MSFQLSSLVSTGMPHVTRFDLRSTRPRHSIWTGTECLQSQTKANQPATAPMKREPREPAEKLNKMYGYLFPAVKCL